MIHYKKGQALHLGKGEILTLVASLFFAIPFTNDAFILQDGFDVPSYLTFALTAPGLTLAFLYPEATKKLLSTSFNNIVRYIVPPAVALSTAVVVLFEAFQKTSNSAVLAAIAQSAAVFTVIGAALFLRERDDLLKKAIATTIVFSGLVILNL